MIGGNLNSLGRREYEGGGSVGTTSIDEMTALCTTLVFFLDNSTREMVVRVAKKNPRITLSDNSIPSHN